VSINGVDGSVKHKAADHGVGKIPEIVGGVLILGSTILSFAAGKPEWEQRPDEIITGEYNSTVRHC